MLFTKGVSATVHKLNNLLIVSHVVHYVWQNRLYAYGPYAREIDLWADLFPQVTIAAPLRREVPPPDCLPFTRSNIEIAPQWERGGTTWQAKVLQMVSLPAMLWKLSAAMRRADAIQVRCPGNLGLLGVILAPLFSRYRVAKYAGQWNGYPGEPLSNRLQRRILSSRWWQAPVLVYGEWEGQPAHIIPFFTSMLDAHQIRRAKESALNKNLHHPLRVLYVGRLSHSKNVHILLNAIARLRQEQVQIEARIVGEGPQKTILQQQVSDLSLTEVVQFAGGLAFEEVLSQYEWGDVLVLASETEGWPKAIAEAMAFGLLCIGSNRGLVPYMLAEGRGLTIEPGNVEMLASALRLVASKGVDFSLVSQKAAQWAQDYSLDGMKKAIREVLTRTWQLSPEEMCWDS